MLFGEIPPPGPTLRGIVEPGSPRWVEAVLGGLSLRLFPYQLALTVGFCASLLLSLVVMLATSFGPVGGAMLLGTIVVSVLQYRRATRSVVGGSEGFRFGGTAISGEAFALLVDTQQRFDYARAMVHQVPTGIEWADVEEDVGTLMWESLPHAARVASLDGNIAEMRYAEPGTPQAALAKQYAERRGEHLEILRAAQMEAESLARVAGNAVAASKVALAATGDLARLEVAVPSGRAMVARHGLAQARARLVLLAEVWAELDFTNLPTVPTPTPEWPSEGAAAR